MNYLENIFIGVISGILATVITNIISQFYKEKSVLRHIAACITDYINEIDKFNVPVSRSSNEVLFSSEYKKFKESYDVFYTEVRNLATLLFIRKAKYEEIMLEIVSIRRQLYNNEVIDINNCIEMLEKIQDTL